VELVGDFKAFLSLLEPGDSDVAAAKAAHEKVRDELRTDDESKEAHTDTFLSGSYARSTAINEINDVDVICILDLDHRITEPEVCLAWIQGILARHYKETKRQGRSVGASAAKGVWLDIVPATPVSADDGPLWIPDREAREWVQTHPKGQIAASVSKNKATDGYFVQTVKLMKFWRDRLGTDPCNPKSYILEALIHGTIGKPSSHAAAIVNVLEGLESSYGSYRNTNRVSVISDPGYTSVNVAKRWSAKEFTDFMVQVKSVAATARSAFSSSDEAASRRLWRQLFGSTFGQ
jgi:SMODS domain-containing protein